MKIISLDGLKKYHTKVKELLNGKANSSHTHTKSQISDFPDIPSGVEEGIWTPKCYNDDYSVSNTYNGIYEFGSAKYIKSGHRVLLTFICYGMSTTEAKSAIPKIATSSFPFVFDNKYYLFGSFVQLAYASPVKGVITFDRANNGNILLYKFEKSVTFHNNAPGYACSIEYITTQ